MDPGQQQETNNTKKAMYEPTTIGWLVGTLNHEIFYLIIWDILFILVIIAIAWT